MATEANELDTDIDSDTLSAQDRLYRRWEKNNWSAKPLDFSQDVLDWQERHTGQQRQALLWNYAMFLDGEESVTVTLAPFLHAAPHDEDRVYLATQVADEARHHVFFDRFLREVCHIGQDYCSTLEATRSQLTRGYRQVFASLDRVSDRLRLTPDSLPLLAQGIALYHLVIEGMLAYTGQQFLRDYASRPGLFPGFAQGITMVARDESRHIAFGIRLPRKLVTNHPACKVAAVELLDHVLPWAAGVFTPPACGLHAIETRLRRAGIEPSEVKALVKVGYADPPLSQASRLIHMINGRVIGTDQALLVNEEALDALFASVACIANWTRAQHPRSPCAIQWMFDEAEPRYLELRPGATPLVTTGRHARPRLTPCVLRRRLDSHRHRPAQSAARRPDLPVAPFRQPQSAAPASTYPASLRIVVLASPGRRRLGDTRKRRFIACIPRTRPDERNA